MKKRILLPLLILLPLSVSAQTEGTTGRDSSAVSAGEVVARKMKVDEGTTPAAPAGLPEASPSLFQSERHLAPWEGKPADIFPNGLAEGGATLPERAHHHAAGALKACPGGYVNGDSKALIATRHHKWAV